VRPRSVVFPVLALFALTSADVAAQQITGRVTGQTGEPLAAVQVFIAGSGIGALSQQNGRYLLLNVPAGTHTLTAERIGYRSVTQQVTVTAGQTVVQDFRLTEEALGLDEIIVTGTPGGTQRRAIGNAVTAVSAAEVTQTVVVNNMQDLLGGRSPGVQFTRASGNVGTGSQIDIRGVGSFNVGGNPLIYVDGIRVNNSMNTGPTLGDQKEVNPLDDLNPQDIESIEIIKGPAAGTLYGTEASAGVIQIITKRGAEGAAQFDVSVTQGTVFMRDPAGRIAEHFSCVASFAPPCREGEGLVVYNPYHEGNRLFAEGWFYQNQGDLEPYSGKPRQLVADPVIWPNPEIFQYGHTRSYNLGVRGGTQAVRYFLSGNFDDEEGTNHYNWDKTYRLRANVGVVFNENFTLDVATGYVDGMTRFGSPAIGDGGEWEDLVWGNGFCVPRINRQNSCERLAGYQEHRPTDVSRLDVTREYNKFTGSGTLNYTNGSWLSSRAIVGADKSWDENRNLFPLETALPSVYPKLGGGTTKGELILEKPTTTNLSVDVSATARFDVSDAIGTATSVGTQYYLRRFSSFRNRGVGFPSPLSTTINQTAPSLVTIGFEFIENKSLGVYFQEELSYNDRLFVTGAIRADDNSAFGSDFDLEYYPKLSATWVVSEESFWNVDVINSLRLRGAWGKAGRQPDAFAGRNQFGVIPGPGGFAILDPSSPGNPAVGPEVSTELELGFDVALLEDRLAAEFTWFTAKNEDALLGVIIPPSVGFPGDRDQNLGRLDNWGWEAMVNARVYESNDVQFSLALTGAMVDNEIKDLGEFSGNNNVRVGWPYPNYTFARWVKSAKYDPNGDAVDNYNRRISGMCDGGIVKIDGKEQPWTKTTPAKYGALPGGELVDCRESPPRFFEGRAFDQYKFSINPTVNLMNTLAIHMLFDGAYGRKQASNQGCGQMGCYSSDYVSRTMSDPMYVYSSRRESWGDNFDASFWKLREIGARWNLPESLATRVGAQNASLSLSARELWIIWQGQEEIYPGNGSEEGEIRDLGLTVEDPEQGRASAGLSSWRTMPPNTVLSATLRVSF
jgi:TonB-linked SusC/RagA family outer membrane protein